MFLLWICFLVRNRLIGWFDFSIKINRSVNNKFLQLSNRNIFQKNYCNTNLLDLEWKWIILYTKLDELCKWSKMSNYAQLSCNLKIGYVLPPPPAPSPKIISQIFWNILHILTVGKTNYTCPRKNGQIKQSSTLRRKKYNFYNWL